MSRAICDSVFCSLVTGNPLKIPLSPQRAPFACLSARLTALRHFRLVHDEFSCDAVNSGNNIRLVQRDGSLRNDVARAVTNEDFHGNAGDRFLFCMPGRQARRRSCPPPYPGGMDSLFQIWRYPFLARSRRSIRLSCGLLRSNPQCSFLSRWNKFRTMQGSYFWGTAWTF